MYNTSDKIITLKPFGIYDQDPRRVHRSSSNAGTVCFGPNATILLSNGTECPMKELKVGDKVATSTPSSTISNLSSQTSAQ
ncbi:hypothetical protein Pelo_19279 [Pelomyxa schiedti]|nr:hypothetical protein Pelo_19279 [Pelomyxa schiedti]